MYELVMGLPGSSGGQESACSGRPGFHPWVGKIPWRRAWQPTPVFLPGETPWTAEPGRLQSTVSQSQTQMSDTAHTWAVNMFWILTPYQSYHLHIYFFSFSDCLLIVLMVFLAVRKLLSLIWPHLLIFDFVSITPGDGPKKIRLWLMSMGVQPVFSLEF